MKRLKFINWTYNGSDYEEYKVDGVSYDIESYTVPNKIVKRIENYIKSLTHEPGHAWKLVDTLVTYGPGNRVNLVFTIEEFEVGTQLKWEDIPSLKNGYWPERF